MDDFSLLTQYAQLDPFADRGWHPVASYTEVGPHRFATGGRDAQSPSANSIDATQNLAVLISAGIYYTSSIMYKGINDMNDKLL